MGVILMVAANSSVALAGCGLLLAGLILWRSSLRHYLRWLVLVLPMAAFFGLVTAWAVDPAMGLLAGFKLWALTTVGYLFFITTPPEDLANSLVKAGLPYSVAFVMGAGMQFVPVLGRKARDVIDAQKARGMPIQIGFKSLRSYPALLVPLLVQAFQLAEELAEAMETRGFGRPGRTFYKNFALTCWDYTIIILAMAVTALLGWGMGIW
jgi:energy-coupling factor transport system permease protein